MDVGFLGLGNMGRAMASNLAKAGHSLRVWNRSPEAARAVPGAQPVAHPSEAFSGDAVVTMLADDDAVRSVIVASGALEAASPETVHVMAATISVALAEELAHLHRQRGIAYVAAPVFGRPEVAEAGALNILAAGDEKAIARIQPLLDAMGQKTWPLGPEPARANAVKLAGNMMIGAAIEAMAEASALVRAHGVAPADFLEILTTTLFASPVYKGYGALIAKDVYEPAAMKLRLGLKDVKLVLAAGEAAHVPLPLASLLRDTLIEAIAHGDGDKDWAGVARVAQLRAGLRS